jgi:Protein of unknown function (DUF3987)
MSQGYPVGSFLCGLGSGERRAIGARSTRDRTAAANTMAKKSIAKTVKQPAEERTPPAIGSNSIMASGVAEANDRAPGTTNGWSTFDSSFLLPPTSPAPRLPIEALPENLRSLVVKFAEARLLSIDYVAAAILTAFSGAIGNRVRLLTFDGDADPLAMFTTLVGPPSVGKSLAISLVEKPLIAIDQALQKTHRLMLRGADQKFLEKFDQKLRETVARRLLLEDLPLEDESADGGGVVAAPGIVLSEFTGAGLLDELRTGIDGRTMIAHELSGALAFGATRSRGLILEGYDGKPKIVRTKTEGKVLIPALLISILGATQPTRLPKLLGDADDGLAARTWWIYPDVEPRIHLPRSPGPVDQLSAILTRIIAIAPANAPDGYSALIPLAADTREPLEAAAARWARLRSLTDGLYRELVGRAVQHTQRLSAVLSIAEHLAADRKGLPLSVGAASVEAAVTLVDDYLLRMGERVLCIAKGPAESDAARLARFLARGGKSVINVRADVLRAAGSPVREKQPAAEALEELRRRNLIRPAARDPEQLGRPSTTFEVHPALLALSSKT